MNNQGAMSPNKHRPFREINCDPQMMDEVVWDSSLSEFCPSGHPEGSLGIHGLLDKLTSVSKEILTMYYLEGLTQVQIAAKLHLTQGGVTVRLSKARNAVKFLDMIKDIDLDKLPLDTRQLHSIKLYFKNSSQSDTTNPKIPTRLRFSNQSAFSSFLSRCLKNPELLILHEPIKFLRKHPNLLKNPS